MELAGRILTIETGKMAGLANGSVLVKYGDTAVLVNATASKEPKEGIDFFPLSVDYDERLYAVGKIPGSFQKKEGKPSEKAILTSRAIDRPIRPLFPKDFRNDVVVSCLVLSVDQDNSPEVCAMIGASAALSISDIPFYGPTASVNVGYIDGQPVINPNSEQRLKSSLTLTVAGTKEKIAMIEAGADELPEDKMLDAIKAGHVEIKRICEFIEMMKQEIGKPKFEYTRFEIDHDVFEEIEKLYKERMYQEIQTDDKEQRDKIIDKITEDVEAYFLEKYGEEALTEKKKDIAESLYKLEKICVREMILNEHKRPDGRKIDEIRPLSEYMVVLYLQEVKHKYYQLLHLE
jgi:polyribonucleotide nucleotidyltransferase